MSLALKHLYQFGEFAVDSDQRVVLRHGIPLQLAPKVFDTLLILIDNSGRIVEKEELMNQLWPDTFVEEGNLTYNVQQLRKLLGDDARKPLFIETVPRRGYRFIANVEESLTDGLESGTQVIGRLAAPVSRATIGGNGVESDPAVHKRPEIESAPVAESAKREGFSERSTSVHSPWTFKKSLAIAAVLVFLVVLSSWLLWRRSLVRKQPTTERLMLAVLPFQNLTGDASQEYFSDGLTEEMIAQLGNLDSQHLGVIARTSVMHYKNSQEALDQIGRELGVQFVLEGSVRRDADRVRITAQLIRAKDQSHVWAREYDRELSHLLALQDEIAHEIGNEIQITLGNQRRAEPLTQSSHFPSTYEAYDFYLKGQYFFNKRTVPGFQHAIECFQRATEIDPNYARAYAGLANSFALIDGYSGLPQTESMLKARAAALRALDIDESLPEAHTSLALIVQSYDWDWETAEKEYRRAIELNPNYATAHHWYAEHLALRGRFDEAFHESERARQLDPLSLIIAADNGQILYFSRQPDRAVEQFRTVLEMDPDFPRAHLIRSAYVEKGRFADALADIEGFGAVKSAPWYWSWLAYVYGRSGQQAQAQHALEKLQELNRRQEIDPSLFLWAYIGMGNKDQAFAWLEKAYSLHSSLLTTLQVEPGFDPLRSDPRFRDLLHRVRLAQ